MLNIFKRAGNRKKAEIVPATTRTVTPSLMKKRLFETAEYNRLTNDVNESYSLIADIQAGSEAIRRRARSAATEKGFVRGIVNNYISNIIGANGIKLNVQAFDVSKDKSGRLSKKLDEVANSFISDKYSDWGKKKNCSVCGTLSWFKLQIIALRTVAIDGEVLVRFHRGRRFGKHQFQVELITVDQLDSNYHAVLSNGNLIFCGVELDEFMRPLAYWIWKYNRNDPLQLSYRVANERVRVPVEDMRLIFNPDFPKQVRGLSWLTSTLLPANAVARLTSAELQTAYMASIKSLYLTKDSNPDAMLDGEDPDEALDYINQDLNVASMDVLPEGWDVKTVDWANGRLDNTSLRKSTLQEMGAGAGVSYNVLAKDLEAVNYSSARFGQQDDRELAGIATSWFIEDFCNVVYEEWLTWQLTVGNIPYRMDRLDKYLNVTWTPRGITSIDPLKDSKADTEDLNNSTVTISQILNKRGLDFEQTVLQQVRERKFIEDAYKAEGLEVPVSDRHPAKVEESQTNDA